MGREGEAGLCFCLLDAQSSLGVEVGGGESNTSVEMDSGLPRCVYVCSNIPVSWESHWAGRQRQRGSVL